MDVLLQRHCAKYIYVVPEGLRELMNDISREVLRSQPEDIYQFIADYLDALMITRENARVAAKFVDHITQIGLTISELLIRTGMTREEADKIVTIIQVCFRNHLIRKAEAEAAPETAEDLDEETPEEKQLISEIVEGSGLTDEIANEAALIIQNAWRNFVEEKERQKDLLRGMVDWRVAARSTLRLYRKTGVTYEEANRAATLIKAAYKGYYTRKLMKILLHQTDSSTSEEYSQAEEESNQEYTTLWDTLASEEVEDEEHEIEIEHIKVSDKEILGEQTIETVEQIAVSMLDSCLKLAIPSTTSITSQPKKAVSEVTKEEETTEQPADFESLLLGNRPTPQAEVCCL